ncbi:lyase family protein [Pseudonocardia acaciae]|uniref:lyase family protein n=1 Tax=Pseudonocardia acaciae TaxID=551276 RepID=UPI0007E8E823|nr:lyase family protein [Pseudonocardia acaciae]
MNWSGNLSSLDANGDEDGALYGAQTRRALANFAVGGPRLADFPDLVRGLALVKMAAASTNARLGVLDREVAGAIVAAAERVSRGEHLGEFVVPVVQGGGGTSTHMNANEVLAGLASRELARRGIDRPVHPNDHVNAGQSTNDVMPTAIALAVRAVADRAAPELWHLIESLEAKAEQFAGLEHLGRTCLRDAVAAPVSAVHRSHAFGVRRGVEALAGAVDKLLAVPLGATAVGTGVGAEDGFGPAAVAELARLSGYPLTEAPDRFYALSSLEPLVGVAEAVDHCARAVARVGADLRLLSSGPVGGIGEVELPAVQAGSSIMPGKVNPVLPELVMQISFQVAGEATSARLAAGAGELDVSAMAPVVTAGLLGGLERLGAGARLFADRCVAGLGWNAENVRANLAGSLTAAVVAARADGYDVVANRGRDANARRSHLE